MHNGTHQHATGHSPTAEPSDGAFARYLTVGGATVNVTRTTADPTSDDASPSDSTIVHCHGCDTANRHDWDTRPHGYLLSVTEAEERASTDACDWAQAHAATCRAMPRPEVTA